MSGDDLVNLRQYSPETDQAIFRFLDEIDDGYYEADLSGRLMFVNVAVVRLTGFSREELLDPQSNHYTNYIDAAAITRLQDVFYAASQGTSTSRTVEVMVRCRDGVTRPLEVSVSLVRDSYGQPQGIRGFVRLMTDPRVLERALRVSMQQLAMLQQVDTELNGYLDPSAILTVGLNAAMSLSRADTGFIALMESEGLRVVRSNGLGSGDHDRHLQLSEGVVGRALRTGRAQFVMDTRNDPDYVGDVPGMEANIVAPLIARDRVVGVLNLETTHASRFSHEVYEFVQLLTVRLAISLDNALLMKTLQEQLTAQQKLYAQVADLEHLKTDMIRIAAHDMRSPLSVIANYITLLRADLGDSLDEAQRGYFDAISRGLDRLFRLSTDVLSLERIQEQHTRPSGLVRFDQLVREVIEQYLPEAEQAHVSLKTGLIKRSVHVVGEALELSEAASNLLTNALKYTPSGGKVVVHLSIHGDRVRYEVRDTGYGIPEAEQARLFQPFYRVKTRETSNISGTGLGLHLVKKIIERHGGEVFFQSRPGEGSLFGFSLPLVQAVEQKSPTEEAIP